MSTPIGDIPQTTTPPHADAATIGSRLRAARRARNLTLRDVESEAGLSKAHLCRIEGGKTVPGLLIAARLAALYGTTLDAVAAP